MKESDILNWMISMKQLLSGSLWSEIFCRLSLSIIQITTPPAAQRSRKFGRRHLPAFYIATTTSECLLQPHLHRSDHGVSWRSYMDRPPPWEVRMLLLNCSRSPPPTDLCWAFRCGVLASLPELGPIQNILSVE